jgi:SOUL heme-binding protein
MQRSKRLVAAALALVLAALSFAMEPVMAKTAEPPFAMSEAAGNIELRTYEPMIVAEVQVTGERDAAIRDGFRILAAYIFGNNISNTKIEMTAPVSQQKSEKIAMTAPVTQQASNGAWQVRFVMPKGATLERLPKPKDDRVRLIAEAAKSFAVIRFSGWSTDSNLAKNREDLLTFVKSRGLVTAGEPVMAFYDPPWTLPFWRRNEIMLELPEQKVR